MEVTRVEQRVYIKIAVLRGRNAMECHSEFVEALRNNALPYRTVARYVEPKAESRADAVFFLQTIKSLQQGLQ
ncbi:hypothetical protein TNCV_2014971 [Trichonephila clavipes]|nr:hypothetical protein TNCV_2014971 [Trichonephila clavipes]